MNDAEQVNRISGYCSTIKCEALQQNECLHIMPSAVAFIASKGKSRRVRVAFDTMCQDSFISEKVAKELNLKIDKPVELEVTGFGAETSYISTGRVNFFLSPSGQKGILYPVDALVKRGLICTPMEAVDLDISNCPHLKHLHLADRFPRKESNVDILIGLNHYLRLVSGEIIRHPQEEMSDAYPSAMKTVFGYVLLGPNLGNRLPKKKS